MLKAGDAVIYHDERGVAHNALLTANWSADDNGAVNLVFVSSNESEQDSYGRQTKRESSVTHVSKTTVHGRYWRKVDEQPNAYAAPASV
jgi:hypothetical protein